MTPPADPVYPPITVTRAPGEPLRIVFPAPEVSPIRAVRESATRAAEWDTAIGSAVSAFNAGDWQRVQEAVGAEEPATEAGARDAIARAGYAADDHYRAAEAAEMQWLREQLPPKAKIRRDGDAGYLVRGDVFALVAALLGSGVASVRVLHSFTGACTSRSCTGSCRGAKLADCRCSCGGRNHGVSIPKWGAPVASSEVPEPENPGALLHQREYLVAPADPIGHQAPGPDNGHHE